MIATQTMPYRQVMAGNSTTRAVVGKRVFVGDLRNLWVNVIFVTLCTAAVAVFVGVT